MFWTWLTIAIFTLGMAFLCLVYSMQFDLNSTAVGTTSVNWMTSYLVAFGIEMFFNTPIAIVLSSIVQAVMGSKLLWESTREAQHVAKCPRAP